MKCADYQDKECVQIVFLLHKETMKENYSLEQIIKECVKEEEENVLAEDKNTDLGTEEEAHILTGQNMTGSQARKWEVRYFVRQKTCGHR